MTIEQAIQKAIEGGYVIGEGKRYDEFRHKLGQHIHTFPREIGFLDPLFWQSLGKAMGWKDVGETYGLPVSMASIGWLYHWHRFIDHLAEGEDAESFFEKL